MTRVRVLSQYPGYAITEEGRVKGPRGWWLRPGGGKSRPSFTIFNKSVYVHVLVALAYLEDRPGPDYQVAHLNGIGTDNRAENLAWKTPKENMADRDLHGKTVRGSKHHFATVTEDDVRSIRSRYARVTYHQSNARELAEEFGVPIAVIRRIVARETWKHV